MIARIVVHRPSGRGWWLAALCGSVGLAALCLGIAPDTPVPGGADPTAAGEPPSSTEPVQVPVSQSSLHAEASPADWRRLARKVSKLQQEVEELQRQLAARPAGRNPADAPAPHPPLDAAATKESERAQASEHAAAREARFREERVDPAWASAETSALRQALAGGQGDEPMGVRSIDCRTRSCRIEVDGEASNARLQGLLARVGGALGSMSTAPTGQPGGGTVLYLER